ncbi:MAG: hypothetical protein JWO74_3214 [Solirubrobacterales bacterium]|jgi:hypothetical protein|nr:hypothetical protein [Solirubrobacterales bacterium]
MARVSPVDADVTPQLRSSPVACARGREDNELVEPFRSQGQHRGRRHATAVRRAEAPQPRRPGPVVGRNLAFDELENPAVEGIPATGLRDPLESARTDMPEQVMDALGPRSRGPSHGVPHAHDGGHVAATEVSGPGQG